ncbi:MAG: sigma-54 dependent transcriptional regulator [Vicinamibacterales bacterium]
MPDSFVTYGAKAPVNGHTGIPPTFLGQSPPILEIIEDAVAIAASDSKVLISGESGVGKEVLARLIHGRSRRSHLPLSTINCAGVPEGLLESEFFGHVRGSFTGADRDRRGFLETADTGTVILDEVGEMSLRMQGMLLRFLENGEIQRVGSDRRQTIVDVRVIAATNRDLLEQVRRKEFREDLYYRLNIVHLVVPPLRERHSDIPLLFNHYLEKFSLQAGVPMPIVTPDVMAVLERYEWPGNVRELKNVAERMLLMRAGQVVTPANLPLVTRSGSAAAPTAVKTPANLSEAIYRSMVDGGESFWSVVYEPFMLRDLTRETLRGILQRGLQHTKGNYRMVAQLFNLPATDYKKFMNFLQKHECQLPFQSFRLVAHARDRQADAAKLGQPVSLVR